MLKAKALVSYGDILIDDSNKVMLKRSGMELDLGGIAKGYASSKVKEYLVELGVESAIINLGGNIDLIGSKPKGVGWRVGIQHPREDRGKYIGILELNDKSLVSSGDYERFFIEDGIRYHHILDVKSGFPRNGEIISASIIGSSSIEGE
ncbi:MAG: hypothetical protein B6229_07780 [Spirochaetaceae bacterium 4572_7]|nr:MAG: hypothetical protein B6229_07780 [Spirochaetaceae bacterium 4572_7]